MSITLVASGTSATSSSGNLTLNEPAGVQQGDLLVAMIGYRGTTAFTLPAGWTRVELQNTGNTGTSSQIGSGVMAYIIHGASAPSYVFTRTSGSVAVGNVSAFRGVDQVNPLDVHTSTTLATASTTLVTGSAITPTRTNSLILIGTGGATNCTNSAEKANTDPTTGWTELFDTTFATSPNTSVSLSYALKTAASTTGTLQTTQSSSVRSVIIAAAFRAAASGSASGAATVSGVGSAIATATGSASGAATVGGVAPVTPVSPGALPNLVSWYDAQDTSSLTLSGSAIVQWNDKSPSGKNLVQATTANAPILDTSSWGGTIQTANFAGTQTIQVGAPNGPISSYSTFTFFAEFDYQPSASYQAIASLDNNGRWSLYINPSGNLYFSNNGAGSPGSVTSVATLSTGHHYVCVRRDASGVLTFRIDGVDDSSPTTITPTTITLSSSTNFFLGCDNNPLPLKSLLGEAFLYTDLKSSGDIASLEAYLIGKWTPPTINAGTGSASGTATVSGVGTAIVAAAGSASGAATVSGAGAALSVSAGTASGTATVSAQGRATAAAAGTAAGAATVQATGQSVTVTTGSAQGVATATATGSSRAAAAGAATGMATVAAQGSSIAHAQGTANGSATVSGTGQGLPIGTGQASGTSDAQASGSALSIGAGQANGVATVQAFGTGIATSTGTSSGQATVSAVGRRIVGATDRMTRRGPGRLRTLTPSAPKRTITGSGRTRSV